MDGDVAGTSVVATRTESEAARKARLVKLESPALAIISLSLQPPVSDWVDVMIAGNNSFSQVWDALKGLYGVSGDQDELSIMETFATLKLTGYQDPLKFYMSIIGYSRQFEACGNTSLSTVARRVVAFMSKIPKAMGDTWETFAPTKEQKKSDVEFMKALRNHYDTKVQPNYRKKGDGDGTSMSMTGSDASKGNKSRKKRKKGEAKEGKATKDEGESKLEKKNTKCFYCDEIGHIKANCPVMAEAKKLLEKRKNGGSGYAGASSMHVGIDGMVANNDEVGSQLSTLESSMQSG